MFITVFLFVCFKIPNYVVKCYYESVIKQLIYFFSNTKIFKINPPAVVDGTTKNIEEKPKIPDNVSYKSL